MSLAGVPRDERTNILGLCVNSIKSPRGIVHHCTEMEVDRQYEVDPGFRTIG
jgi:hypothetical protein